MMPTPDGKYGILTVRQATEGCAVIGSLLLGVMSGTFLSFPLFKSFYIMRTVSVELTVIQRILIALLSFIAGLVISVMGALSPIRKIKRTDLLSITKD